MYFTPEEAKDKWCPFADSSKCVGTFCMAWRFKDDHEYKNNRANGNKHGKGYCGLVGGR